MPTELKIAITKGILAQSKNCGTANDPSRVGNNCAIAIALADLFPKVYITDLYIFPFGIENEKEKEIKIPLPGVAQQFIKLFDGFRVTPRLRLMLPEFEFTIDVPDEIIEQINIDDVKMLTKDVISYSLQNIPAQVVCH